MNKARLLKLASFLEKLPKGAFKFHQVVNQYKDNMDKARNGKRLCGSICCAIGWTPKLWPKIVEWNQKGYYSLYQLKLVNSKAEVDFDVIAVKLFDITLKEARALFRPDFTEKTRKRPWTSKMPADFNLRWNAPVADVVKNIRAFVKWKKANG